MNMQTIRACVADVSRVVGLLRLVEQGCRDRLTVLTYHRVLPRARRERYPLPDLAITPETFRQHCRILGRHFHGLPLGQAIENWAGGKASTQPLAAITCDDGYRDNLEYAAPILAETGLTATFFVIAGLVGTEAAPWYDRLGRVLASLPHSRHLAPELLGELAGATNGHLDVRHLLDLAKRLEPLRRRELVERLERATGKTFIDPRTDDDRIMGFDALRQLIAAGHEIGSHSHTHEILPLLDDAALHREVTGSRQRLEENLGVTIRSFCYPNGDLDDRVARAVAAAGYTCATSTVSGANLAGQDVYRLRRRFMHEERLIGYRGRTSSPLLRAELCGLADRMFLRNRRSGGRA